LLEAVRIQNLLPDTTTLIALSSDSTRYVKESFLDLGVHQIERKPILIDRLDQIVSEHYQFKKALNTVLTSYKQSGIKSQHQA
jgi:arsenate reductase-like glutaredoxin family protein